MINCEAHELIEEGPVRECPSGPEP